MSPENAVARLNLANAILPTDPTRARELVEQAVLDARHPAHRYRAHSFLCRRALEGGRVEEAELQARRACDALGGLPADPTVQAAQREALLQLASIQLARGREGPARETVAAATEISPDHPVVLAYQASLMLMDAADDRGRVATEASWAPAKDLLERALETDPGHFEANLAKARWHKARGEWMSAVRHLRRSRKAAPHRVDTYLFEADLFMANGDYPAAEAAARAGMAAGVRDPNLLIRLGPDARSAGTSGRGP